jgi:hypothetical protein
VSEAVVRIDAGTTAGGLLRYTYTREDRAGDEQIGTVTQVAEHRWEALRHGALFTSGTPHRSCELAEQALLQRAGLGGSAITYKERNL